MKDLRATQRIRHTNNNSNFCYVIIIIKIMKDLRATEQIYSKIRTFASCAAAGAREVQPHTSPAPVPASDYFHYIFSKSMLIHGMSASVCYHGCVFSWGIHDMSASRLFSCVFACGYDDDCNLGRGGVGAWVVVRSVWVRSIRCYGYFSS